jgi:hypothetical protein
VTIRTLIFFDTNVFSTDSSLSSPSWDSLADAAQSGLVEMAVSDITVAEITRQVGEKAEKFQTVFAAAQTALKAHGVRAELEGPIVTASYDANVRSRLKTRQVDVIPLPSASHAEVVKRDIDVRKPFDRSGKGYRDTLIWLTFLEWLGNDRTANTPAYFVSTDTGDFREDKSGGQLAAELKAELPVGADVSLVTMKEIVTTIRDLKRASAMTEPHTPKPNDGIGKDEGWHELMEPSAQETAGRSGLMTFRAIVGDDGEKYVDPILFRLDQVENVTVSWVEVEEDSVEATLVDTVSGSTIWDVRASARIEIEGLVHRGEAFVLSSAWDARIVDTDDVYVQVTHSLQCTLVADVRVEADEETADGVLTDVLFLSAVEYEH